MGQITTPEALPADTPERTHWIRAIAVGFGILAVSGIMEAVSSAVIREYFPDRPVVRDLAFILVPYVPSMRIVTDILMAASAVLLLIYAFRGRVREIPRLAAVFGLMELARTLLMMTTPLMVPLRNIVPWTIAGLRNLGEWPSGHMSTVVLFYLLIDRREEPVIKTLALIVVYVELATLWLSQAHYTIAIAGGALLSYWVYHEWYDGWLFDWLKPLVKV